MRLIDADALKEEVNKKKVVGRFNTIMLIDNAPTVETYSEEDMCDTTSNGFDIGYDFAKAKYERPQGEWLWLGDNPNPNHKWSCNKCGRGVKEQENFCPNCGLKMRKGGAE